ncbi:iron complex outermembrane receptor protein [Roseimicrobium gellanilyticum]|uniref:Iron complex outermembrane receptor protein n=1 Tax=Roseimicrobium gellanilyticum TaxID=748857 RepID=A0A366HID3_9BACT|nr:TonB-dependent siderophore receptor [Roseimicrobium gellanilyticum]RBP42527.1 iron complex outermembrane receptor protein [Roseimicrobium gellanilyticum]
MKLKPLGCAALLVMGSAAHAQTTTAPAPAAEQTLAPITVTADAENTTYNAPTSTVSGLKTDTPLLETPQAISVVPQAVIKDQAARDLGDVIKNVAGVTPGGYYSEWDYYRIRGFDAAFTTYQDGLRGDYDGIGAETFGLERVEVIKGPASTLYGQAPLGGIVNLVSKRPRREFGGEIGFTGGTWDFYEGTIDINVPLLTPGAPVTPAPLGKGAKAVQPIAVSTSDDLGIYFRLAALYRDKGSFVDYYDYERIYIAPSLTFEWGDDTSLTFLTSYLRDDGLFSMPLPARGTVLPNPNGEIPVSRFIGVPGKSGLLNLDTLRLGYEFKHRFNDSLSIRQNLAYYRVEQHWNDILYNSVLDDDLRTLYANPYDYNRGLYQRFMVDTAVDFLFDTGSIKHSLTLGTDYYYSNQKARYTEINYDDFPGSYVAIDLFKPNYNVSIPQPTIAGSFLKKEHNVGIYLQDHMKLTDKLTFTVGGRYEYLWLDDSGSYGSIPADATDDAFTPKAGITYEFVPGVAAYANYSRSYAPQWGSRDETGAPIAPEEGENWEGGVKYDLLDGRLTGMISVFQLTRENVATSNLATPDPSDATVSGEQRSRGFEFETAAELLPGLQLIAAYTYLDAEVTEDNDIPVGTPLLGVPDHTVTAWLKYTVQDGPLKGFGVGVGGRYYSSQSGDTYHTFDLPSYGLVDTALFYERENYRIQVNFNNVFDKRHFVGSYDELYVLPGEPFNVSASVTWKF